MPELRPLASGSRPGRLRRGAGNLAFAAVVVAIVLVAWPTRLGGRALFVVVHGTSMEPTYHAGDLLYARTARVYGSGQTAIYRLPAGEPGAGELVVHRIQGRTADGRYIMQGDNRPSDDGALPAPTDLVARPVANLGPGPVAALRLIPGTALLVVAATLGWYLWPSPDRRHTTTPSRPGGRPARRPAARPVGSDLRGSWALVRDASVGHRPLPPAADVPFAADAPLSLGDLFRFMVAADQVQVG